MSTVEQGTPAAVATTYQVDIVNQSGREINTMVFAQAQQTCLTLVWRSVIVGQGDRVTLSWSDVPNFVQGTLAAPEPGVKFAAAQVVEAVPGQSNQVTLEPDGDGGLVFTAQQPGPPGTLLINQAPDVPAGQGYAVGVGIGGLPTFITTTVPGTRVNYGYAPQLIIATGTFEQGQLMSAMGIEVSADLDFPPGTTSMTATFSGAEWAFTS